MKNYRVQMMTINDYNKMVLGSLNYAVREVVVQANDVQDAYNTAKAQFNGFVEFVVNENIISEEEREAREQAYEEERKAEALAAQARKAKMLANETKQALALGLTVEEYREAKAMKAKKTRYMREIKELEARIAALQNELNRKKEFVEKM